jgi:hypothetical protein
MSSHSVENGEGGRASVGFEPRQPLKLAFKGAKIHVLDNDISTYPNDAEYRFTRRHCASSMLSGGLSTFRQLSSK